MPSPSCPECKGKGTVLLFMTEQQCSLCFPKGTRYYSVTIKINRAVDDLLVYLEPPARDVVYYGKEVSQGLFHRAQKNELVHSPLGGQGQILIPCHAISESEAIRVRTELQTMLSKVMSYAAKPCVLTLEHPGGTDLRAIFTVDEIEKVWAQVGGNKIQISPR